MTSLLKLLRLSHTSPSRCCPSVGNSQTDRSSSCCAADGSNQDILLLSPSSCQHANQIFMSNNKPPHSCIVIVGWKQYVLLTGPLLPNLQSLNSKIQHFFPVTGSIMLFLPPIIPEHPEACILEIVMIQFLGRLHLCQLSPQTLPLVTGLSNGSFSLQALPTCGRATEEPFISSAAC